MRQTRKEKKKMKTSNPKNGIRCILLATVACVLMLGLLVSWFYPVPVSAQQVELRLGWDEVVDAEGYRMYGSEVAGQYSTSFAEIPAGTLELTITRAEFSMVPGKNYFFVVTAYNPYTESEHSNEVSNRPYLRAPGSLRKLE